MGLLDDAIREHLDLKRRRGADPADIERAEREALGPVRRNRDTAVAEDTGELGEPAYAAPGSALDEPDEGIAADLVDETGDDLAFEDDLGAVAIDEDEELIDDDSPATRVMQITDVPPPGPGTAEYDVEEAFAADEDEPFADEPAPARAPTAPSPGEGDEDVLEETPEFLQDTPDHDRLWFEQRPPRDFDFDG